MVKVVGAAPLVEPERRSSGPHYHARSLLEVVPILLRITTIRLTPWLSLHTVAIVAQPGDRLGCKAENRHPIPVYLPYLAGTAV